MNRKIFIDCGAHNGCSIKSFSEKYSDYQEYEVYSFECHGGRYQELVELGKQINFFSFTPSKKAIWISDGLKSFDGWQFRNLTDIDDNNGIETIDLSQFILNNFSKEDFIVLKFDIEGAEYKVIDKMYNEKSLNYISQIYGELHGPKRGYTIEDNKNILNQIWDCGLKLFNWDALEGTNEKIEIVPFNTPGSYKTKSSPRVGHAYKKIING
jgi:FkbM family methyltransferase